MIPTDNFVASRASRLDAILQKKKRASNIKQNEMTKEGQLTAEEPKQESADAHSLQRSASSDPLENTVEIKAGVRIPKPTKELSLEELIAIAKQFHDPNVIYPAKIIFNPDGRVIKEYPDGTIKNEKIVHSGAPFNSETQALINWYKSENALPKLPYKWEKEIFPKGFYELINSWIEQGNEGTVQQVLSHRLKQLKRLIEKIKK
jgi:hypothetical protein